MSSRSSTAEAAVLAMAVGSVLVVLCVVSLAFAVQRRRQRLRNGHSSRPSGLSLGRAGEDSCIENPTDFMNSLASWDHSLPIGDLLEQRRRAVWTLELFESHGMNDSTHNGDDSSAEGNSHC